MLTRDRGGCQREADPQPRSRMRSVHAAATGYIKGQNILQNAQHHRDSRVILKLDFIDFFPSIKAHDWDFLLRVLKSPLIQQNEWLY
jgi:hypothetical protein